MIQKMIKALLSLFVAALFMCMGVLAGGGFQEEHQHRMDSQSEVTTKIAVVNLDDGIEFDGKKTYYAQNMVMLPNSNFFLTNLEDARSGIKQGQYAAYIVIPVSYSKSIESINGTPVKVTLEYELNKNLKAAMKPDIVAQIHEFQNLLSENTTYIYVSAILREYHKAQDSSKTVMENGKVNVNAVKNIVVEDLFIPLRHPELERPDFERFGLDIDKYLNQNSNISEFMNHNFRETMQQGQDSFDYVKDAHREVEVETEKLTGYVNDMKIGEETYASGVEELKQLIDTFNLEQGTKRNWVKTELASQSNATRAVGQQHVDIRLEEILTDWQLETDQTMGLLSSEIQSLVDLGIIDLQDDNGQIIQEGLLNLQLLQEEAYERLCLYVDIRLEEINQHYELEANNWLMDFIEEVKARLILSEDDGEEPSDEADAAVTSLLATFSNASISLATSSDAWIDMAVGQDYFPSLATADFAIKNAVAADQEEKDETLDFWIKIPPFLFILPERNITLPDINTNGYDGTVDQLESFYNISSEEIRKALDDNVISAVTIKIDENSFELREIIDEFNHRTEDYQRSLDKYDPYEYIDMSFLSQSLRDIEGNLRDMERSVSDKSRAEEKSVDDIFRTTSDNTDGLWNTMETTYDSSQENVVRTVKELRGLHEGNYTADTELLSEFSRQLSYTRLGSVGNKSVYDFISNPILLTSRDSGKANFFQFDSDYRKLTIIAISALASISIALVPIYILLRIRGERGR